MPSRDDVSIDPLIRETPNGANEVEMSGAPTGASESQKWGSPKWPSVLKNVTCQQRDGAITYLSKLKNASFVSSFVSSLLNRSGREDGKTNWGGVRECSIIPERPTSKRAQNTWLKSPRL